MKKKYIIIIGVLVFIAALGIGYLIFLSALSGIGNPTGGRGPDYPYFITTESVTVKKIAVPKGTKLIYEEQFFKKGQQDKIMNEKKLTDIHLPEGKTIEWGGVPVYTITKFFNPEMTGYSVFADFSQLRDEQRTKFSELWRRCGGELGVLVKDADDWTFNTKNITDIANCSVNYQRYFKEDDRQQKFLDSLYNALGKQVKIK
ncbi:hypothetical protein [Sphingobacterium athyrii]|uniref:Uncharacterized protein n=1 Tax=Sphingobacterium athyrii TaxID=2152717 RepID=A0A363NSX7_9SPHI|nr:hypothetical protein [Sphingobacterium athyrii]PUV23916.1 hypothetical protein DCO56_11050 [Sphingobacterium athyrii]